MSRQTAIEFKDLSIIAKSDFTQRHTKPILKGVSGSFRGCELSAVIGPSGCGKSTLLNILSGFTKQNVCGTILVNGEDQHLCASQSTYIMQDENLHLLLTVYEVMHFAVKFKTGKSFSDRQQHEKIVAILETLKLHTRVTTFVRDLSGGQRKRLSIAVELVDDPMILFLDEPTTGLDSSSSSQCIQLLKNLAKEGKTIVCTIHTPSALLFEMFDHLYALADGHCIYQGSVKNLVPFLAELDFICPATFNPADFLLEIATNDYGAQNSRLTVKIEDGRNQSYRRCVDNGVETFAKHSPIRRSRYSSSFRHQFNQLMFRNCLILKRDKSTIVLRFLINFVVGTLVGLLYIGNGNDASQIFNVFKYIFVSVFFLMYTSYYSLQTTFSIDLPIVKREHFNRWYSTGAYYLALSTTDIPFTIISTLIYVSLTYVLTNQPLEEYRMATFLMIGLLTSFTSQGFGLLAGSMFELKGTLTFASIFLPLYAIFAGIFIFMKDSAVGFHWIFEISFVKHALDGASVAILGSNRTKFDCDTDYCHYRWPNKFLESIGLVENLTKAVQALLFFMILFRVSAFCIMNYRLKH